MGELPLEIRATTTQPDVLARYADLFQSCFPGSTHLGVRYLKWLYEENPAGTVIGCDAWSGNRLAAHYVCVPVDARVSGVRKRVMLSLNTATHPDFQGKGLFTRLAEATYEAAARAGVVAVYGVANANSTPGFTRKLGFVLVQPLDALIGLGRLDADIRDRADSEFERDWSVEAIRWRASNPERPYSLRKVSDRYVAAQAPTGKPGLHAWDEIPLPEGFDGPETAGSPGLRLHLGLRPGSQKRSSRLWIEIPQRLRPSPLNFIFRSLNDSSFVPSRDTVRLGQLDFDAF